MLTRGTYPQGVNEMKYWRSLLQILLIIISIGCLSVAILTGLLHEWHRLAFLSLAGLDNSFTGTLVLLMGGIGCWIGASCLSDDRI